MFKHHHLIAIGIVSAMAGGSVVADDGDVQHAQILLEEARTFGVPTTTGLAAGQIDAQREERRARAEQEANDRTPDEKRWEAILEAQSLN